MNKKELIEFIADEAEVSKADAGRMVDAFVDAVSKTLKKDSDVAIAGLGTFTTSKRAARNGRNPKTGETIQIPPMTVAKFKAAKALKEAVK